MVELQRWIPFSFPMNPMSTQITEKNGENFFVQRSSVYFVSFPVVLSCRGKWRRKYKTNSKQPVVVPGWPSTRIVELRQAWLGNVLYPGQRQTVQRGRSQAALTVMLCVQMYTSSYGGSVYPWSHHFCSNHMASSQQWVSYVPGLVVKHKVIV